jgi:hypothetical protein
MKDGSGIGASGIYSASPSRHWSVEPFRRGNPAGGEEAGGVSFARPGGAVDGGPPDGAGAAEQRTVLAALLVDAGAAVPAETIIDRVWGDAPPAEVRNALYSYVKPDRDSGASARPVPRRRGRCGSSYVLTGGRGEAGVVMSISTRRITVGDGLSIGTLSSDGRRCVLISQR